MLLRSRLHVVDPLVLTAACFALYAALAARDVMFGDGAELTAAAILNGVAHPPGFPLWIVLGHLASLVPVGTLAYRVNLTAAFYHALTVGLVFCSASILARSRIAAYFSAVSLAIASPLFVSWSLQAEAFSLEDAFTAAIVLLCLLWLEEPRRPPLLWLAVLFGFGMAAQPTLALLAPAAGWAAWCGRAAIPRDARTLRMCAAAIALLVAGFALPYVHTLLASRGVPDLHAGAAHSLPQLLDVIDRKLWGTFSLVTPGAAGGNPLARIAVAVAAAGWPYLFIASGIATLAFGRRFGKLGLAVMLLAFPLIGFCVLANMDTTDPQLAALFSRFGLLPLVALAPFAACVPAALQRAVPVLPAAVALAGAFALPQLSLAGVHDVRTVYRDASNALPPHAILMIAAEGVDDASWYFQAVEGWRPDVTVVSYGLATYPSYDAALQAEIAVPAGIRWVPSAQALRDGFARANPGRPFFVLGERGIHAPGPFYQPYVLGIVSQMIARDARADVRAHYIAETRLQTAPGYGDVSSGRWTSGGFAASTHEYYAGGFFSTGVDAQRLGKLDQAIRWYRRAQAYFNDPMIQERIDLLQAGLPVR